MIAKRSPGILIITMGLILGFSFRYPAFCQIEAPALQQLQIPSVGQLVDSAYLHSPLLNEQEAIVRIREWQEKSTKKEWEKYILFYSEVRYGSVDIMVSNGGVISYGDKSNSTRYNVGARFQFTIFDLLDQRKKNIIAKEQINLETYKIDELKRMIRDDVIRLWSKLTTYKEIVAINEDHVASQNGNFFYAEQQYKKGDIPLVEYARIKEISIKAEQENQLAKREFRETYMLLENLVGVKLSEMNPSKK